MAYGVQPLAAGLGLAESFSVSWPSSALEFLDFGRIPLSEKAKLQSAGCCWVVAPP